jgi:bifunctional non-homologous end joining protein LigD
MAKLIDSTNLQFQDGTSDKVYNVKIESDGQGFSVHFSYGRRGGNMTEGYKVQGVSEASARKEYDKLVASKTKKGYWVV